MILNKDGKNHTRIFSNTLRLIAKHFFTLLFGQLIFVAISIFMLVPVIHYIFDYARSLSGFSYITINNFLYFLMNPFTIVIFLLVFLIIGFYFLLEASFLVTFYSVIENGDVPKLASVFFLSLKRLILTILHRNFSLLPIIWVTIIVSNVPLIIFIAENFTVFRYASKFINTIRLIYPLFIILFLLLLLLMYKRLFVFQYCIFEGRSYKAACQLSMKLKKKRVARTFAYLIGWNVGISIFIYILHTIAAAVTSFLVICITKKELAVATFISLNERMSTYFAIGIFMISIAANFALFTHLLYQYKKEENEYFYFDDSVETAFLKLRSYKALLIFFGISFIILNVFLAFDIIKNDALFVYVDFDMIKITSHRGFSLGVPENTIPAIEKSMEEQADFIEVDVRQTKDGELVLLHDESLKRTTGIRQYIWNVDYLDVSQMDAGKWVGKDYIDTRIPTLREVFDLCKGNININLDLKDGKHISNLEEHVASLINEYNMESQCVVTSTSLSILENIKKVNEEIKTGYITYQIQQKDYNNKNIDFFSINSCFASENLIQDVHENGKEVYVWTVNSKSELERMKRLGVDNIITDNPSFAKEILFEDKANHSFISLLRTMMEY